MNTANVEYCKGCSFYKAGTVGTCYYNGECIRKIQPVTSLPPDMFKKLLDMYKCPYTHNFICLKRDACTEYCGGIQVIKMDGEGNVIDNRDRL